MGIKIEDDINKLKLFCEYGLLELILLKYIYCLEDIKWKNMCKERRILY